MASCLQRPSARPQVARSGETPTPDLCYLWLSAARLRLVRVRGLLAGSTTTTCCTAWGLMHAATSVPALSATRMRPSEHEHEHVIDCLPGTRASYCRAAASGAVNAPSKGVMSHTPAQG